MLTYKYYRTLFYYHPDLSASGFLFSQEWQKKTMSSQKAS